MFLHVYTCTGECCIMIEIWGESLRIPLVGHVGPMLNALRSQVRNTVFCGCGGLQFVCRLKPFSFVYSYKRKGVNALHINNSNISPPKDQAAHTSSRITSQYFTIMNTASSSTASLLSSRPSATKNWEAAYGNLSSQYGFGGNVPSLPQGTQKPSKKAAQSTSLALMSSQPNPSVPRPAKDYQAAFGQLSSANGFGGSPSLPSKYY